MRFTADSGKLGAALRLAMACAEKRTTIPILTHVLIEALDTGHISITASDLDREVKLTIPAEVHASGEAAVDGAMLLNFASRVKAGSDTDLETSATKAKVSSGRSRAEIPVLPHTDFPSLGAVDGGAEFAIEGTALQDALDGCLTAAATQELNRTYLLGVHLHPANRKWIAVATDGHRLHKSEVAAPSNGGDLLPIIIPSKSVQLAKNLFKNAERISLSVSAARMSIWTETAALNSKLIDGAFPDYVRIIPVDQPYKIRVNREDLAGAINRALAAAEVSAPVKLAFSGDTLTVSASNGNGAWSSDEVDADCAKADLEIGATAQYLNEAIAFIGEDEIEVSVMDASSPFVIRSGRPGHLAVVMPRRA